MSFTKIAAAELSRCFNGLAVRAKAGASNAASSLRENSKSGSHGMPSQAATHGGPRGKDCSSMFQCCCQDSENESPRKLNSDDQRMRFRAVSLNISRCDRARAMMKVFRNESFLTPLEMTTSVSSHSRILPGGRVGRDAVSHFQLN